MEALFNTLLAQVSKAYQKSDIRKVNKDWGYSLSATKLQPNAWVIVGFNWGAAKNEKYTSQVDMPHYSFWDEDLRKDQSSFKKIYAPLKKAIGEVSVVQTNYCFFRSSKEGEISARDIELCQPIFNDLIEKLNPKGLIIFSRKLHYYLESQGVLDVQTLTKISGRSRVYAEKGSFKIADQKIPYHNLPHPNSPVNGEIRKECWNYCFD